MKRILSTLAIVSSALIWQACSDDPASSSEEPGSSASALPTSSAGIDEDEPTGQSSLPDYSRAIAVNKMLGHGINFGNSWDSGIDPQKKCEEGKENDWCYTEGKVYDYLDEKWNNPIDDEWFKIAKDAGFQSIRLPVRWNQTALQEPPYTIQAERVAGVKHHIDVANSLGMPVVINQHHFNELYENPDKYLPQFYAIWEQIAEEFKDYSNDSLVFEVLNESRGKSDKILAQMTDSAIKIIRKTNPGRTIMIDPGNYGKFDLMGDFADIKDSNIIIDGHYYEPYSYSHQGHNGACGSLWKPIDQTAALSIVADLKNYVQLAKKTFPGKNGTYAPLYIGEFGASSACEAEGVDDENRSYYIKAIVEVANQLGYTWAIWGFTGVQFDIYDKGAGGWYPKILEVLQKNM